MFQRESLFNKLQKQFKPDLFNKILHLAILQKEYLDLLISGEKYIESRMSKRNIAPYEKVQVGDFILFKESAKDIVGIAEVKNCWFFKNPDIEYCRKKFNSGVCGTDEYWSSKVDSKYATFILLSKLYTIQPIQLKKTDGRSWGVLN